MLQTSSSCSPRSWHKSEFTRDTNSGAEPLLPLCHRRPVWEDGAEPRLLLHARLQDGRRLAVRQDSRGAEGSYKFWPLDPKSLPNPRRMLLLWRWRATMTRCRFVRRCPARPRTREISRLARMDFSSRFLKWWRRWSGQVSADVSNNFVRYSHFYTHPNVIATQISMNFFLTSIKFLLPNVCMVGLDLADSKLYSLTLGHSSISSLPCQGYSKSMMLKMVVQHKYVGYF